MTSPSTTGRARRARLDCIPSNMAKRRGPRTPVVLIVLDGWGFRPGREGNAVELGDTPVWHRLWSRAPRTLLSASGLAVGLPDGQMGNSEVGHLNLGPPTPVISTVVGRNYAMDRGNGWERTKLAYDAMAHVVGAPAPDALSAVRAAYQAGETDEFVKPRVITGTPRIRSGDGVFCFNLRADRMRQLVRALALDGFDAFDTGRRPSVELVTMTQYDETFSFPMAFGPMVLSQIVAQVLSDQGKTMFRTAETEKYAHVTYFFNGGLEPPYPREERLPAPAQAEATYDL